MRRGITPVVAIAILLGMTVVAAGGAYTFITMTTQGAQEEASDALATGMAVKAVICSGGLVDITISNTGETSIDASEAALYVRSDGELVSGRTGIATGTDTLAPGDVSRFRLLGAAAMRNGRDYTVEVGFPRNDVTATATCDGGSAAAEAAGYWRMNEDVSVSEGFEGGTDGASIPATTDWIVDEWALEFDSGQVAEGSLSAYTTSVDPGCPLMHRQMFDRERNVSFFSGWYRETSGSTGHGVSLRDANRERILGWYTNNPQFGVYSSDGFDGGQDTSSLISGLNYDTWYQVNVSVDWTAQSFTVVHSGNASKTLGPYPMNGSPQYLYAESSDDNNWECNPKDAWLDGFSFRTDVTDRSGSGNHLVFPADETAAPSREPSCRDGGCFGFDGADDQLLAPDRPSLDITDEITIAAWINWSGGGGNWQGIMSKGDAQPYALTLNDDGFIHFEWARSGCGSDFETEPGTLAANTWHHVAASYDGSTVRLFVDGEMLESFSLSSCTTSTTSEALRIGQGNDGEYFSGRIDDVQVLPVALR